MTTPIKVVAVDRHAISPGIVEVRAALDAGGAPAWKHIKFGTSVNPDNKVADLLNQLTALNAAAIDTIEIVAEGTPFAIDSLDTDAMSTAAKTFGAKLKQNVPGMGAGSKIYLSGCNTGLPRDKTPGAADHDIAQLVANSSHAIVLGARGYLSGAHALANEQCFVSFAGKGPFPDATQAKGAKVWRACSAPGAPHPMDAVAPIPPPPELPPNRVMAPLTPKQIERLLRDVHGAPLQNAPTFRVGPERVISVSGGHSQTYHVIANAAFLRDAYSYAIWPNSQGHELLTLAQPHV